MLIQTLLVCRSAFFFFCGEFRASIKADHPDYNVGEIAKELGKRWEKVSMNKGLPYILFIKQRCLCMLM